MQRCWDRTQWRDKKEINRILRLRAQEPANRDVDWRSSSRLFNDTGAIYAIYHFTQGRWYVGQTISAIHKRAQDHWWSRFRDDDAFHQALGLEDTPFSYIALPLEWIPKELYMRPGLQRRPQIKEFRRVATPRERYWVDKLNCMYPYGWNSAVPGRPVAAYVLRSHQNHVEAEEQHRSQEEYAKAWIQRWRSNSEEAVQDALLQPKATIRDIIHHLQARHKPQELLINGQSPVPLLIEELRRRRKEPPSRQFLKMRFTNNSARDLNLRPVLRDPTVYHLHPEPECAAAIMVSESFDPQIQGFLFNYTEAALQLVPEQALSDDLLNCLCRSSFTHTSHLDLGPSGHVCTFDTTNLKWGYLSSLTARGKKFRLPASSDTVLQELNKGLEDYVTWSTKKDQDPRRLKKLEEWAAAVHTKCLANWQAAQAKKPLGEMDGFPGLKQAIKEAREHLVFLHDDRAPHGMFMVCKRWYQQEMARYLSDSTIFEEVPQAWDEVARMIAAQVERFSFKPGKGIPYNYGIWKAKKGKFRYIAGTRSPPKSANAKGDTNQDTGPPRSPTYNLCKALVKVLDHVGTSLQALDEKRQRETGLRCYWPIKSVNEFTRYVRAHAAEVVRQGMATYDFSTMYTSFDQATIRKNVMEAFKEAQHYEASKCPTGEALPNMTDGGWVFGDGWTFEDIDNMLHFSLSTAYTVNGGKVRRQVRGMPMGIPHAPQMANLACYVVERDHVLRTKESGLICRYIDDFIVSGCTPPPQEAYGMAYSKTSTNPQDLVYLGVRCRIEGDRLRTTIFDREEDYPFHITRYPEWETTAPRTQLGGVLMGRYIACLEACSHMQDFKESVANVVRHATWRNYPQSLIKSTWTRFLQRRWQSADIRNKELINWFKTMTQFLRSQGVTNRPPNARVPQPPVRSPENPQFWAAFGRQAPLQPPPPSGVTQDNSQPSLPRVTQDRSHPPHTSPLPPAQRPEKERACHPAAEDDSDSPTLQLVLQLSMEQQAGICQDSTPSFIWDGQQTADGERHPSGLNIGHALPGLSSCAASSCGVREQTHQQNASTPAIPCVMDCDSFVPLPDCTSTIDVGAAHGDPRITEPMCAGVVFTTGPRANPPHECMSASSTFASAMALDQPEVEQPPLPHSLHVSREVIVVDRPVPTPYPVPVPVDRPYPVACPVPVENKCWCRCRSTFLFPCTCPSKEPSPSPTHGTQHSIPHSGHSPYPWIGTRKSLLPKKHQVALSQSCHLQPYPVWPASLKSPGRPRNKA
jgi:hypothetical protein